MSVRGFVRKEKSHAGESGIFFVVLSFSFTHSYPVSYNTLGALTETLAKKNVSELFPSPGEVASLCSCVACAVLYNDMAMCMAFRS